ncbi:MAG: lytic transglycosylase [Methylocystis sp.]|nr:MAG: lytic transglycosylase [Methylocystis sp.]
MSDLTLSTTNTERRMSLRARWAQLRADRSFGLLLRTLCVGAALSMVAALCFSIPHEEAPRSERLTRFSRAKIPMTPLAQLVSVNADTEAALDSDFSLEQAALTWSHRLGKDSGVADAPGVMRFGSVKVNQSIVERVVQAANKTEMDPALLMAIAEKESNFSSTAKAKTSSASGLFQFVEKTWMQALKDFGHLYGRHEEAEIADASTAIRAVAPQKRAQLLGLRNDPYLSAALAAEMLKKDGAKIAEKVGRALTAGETYLIHFLGPEDTSRFMTALNESPNMSAAALLPKPARANRPIFYEQAGRKMRDKTVAEVHEAFESMMDKRTSRYEDVAQKIPAGAMAYTE